MNPYKNTLSRALYLLCTLFFLFSLESHAHTDPWIDVEKQKTIEQTVSVSRNQTLEIKNNFGKVEVKNWDRPEVKIQVTVKVRESNQQRAESTLNNIHIKANITSDKVSFVTQIEKTEISIWEKFFKNQNGKHTIDYEVYAPSYLAISISNNYGNILLGDRLGSSQINLNYGKFHAKSLQGKNNTLKINYSEAQIGTASQLDATIVYGKIDLNKVKNLAIKLVYASGSKVGLVEEKLVGSLTYAGNFELGLADKFEKIDLKTTYSPIKIRTNSSNGFQFDLSSSYGNIIFDKSKTSLSVEKKGNTTQQYVGQWGKQNNGEIFIKSTYGNVTFQ